MFTFVPFPGAPPKVIDAYVNQSVFPGCFANCLSARDAAECSVSEIA